MRVLDDAEYAARLDEKLSEEVQEYLDGGGVAELADLVEVVRAILAHRDVSWDEFEALREALAAVEKSPFGSDLREELEDRAEELGWSVSAAEWSRRALAAHDQAKAHLRSESRPTGRCQSSAT